MSVRNTRQFLQYIIVVVALAAWVVPAAAQSTVTLSANADFSTEDRLFFAGDSVFIEVVVDDAFDVTTVSQNAFEVKPLRGDGGFEGSLTNNLDGSFTAAVQLPFDVSTSAWKAEVDLEDDADHEVEARALFNVRAANDHPTTITVRGDVTAARDTEVDVGGTTILINEDTNIIIDGQTEAQPADLVGLFVTAVVTVNDAGQLVASQIIGHSPDHVQNSIRLRGDIEAIGLASITVEGVEVQINDGTHIEGEGDALITLADLSVGLGVEVQAVRVDDAWVATQILIRTRDDDEGDDHGDDDHGDDDHGEGDHGRHDGQEIHGTIDAVGDAGFEIGDLAFVVTDETEFRGVDGLDGLVVGSEVEVEFIVDDAGDNVALKVKVDDETDDEGDENEVEVSGTITAIGDATIEVDGVTFLVDEGTVIEGHDDEPLALADLTTGMQVKVEGENQEDGTILALKIEVEDVPETELHVAGRVEVKTDDTLTVNGTTFFVDEATIITGDHDTALGFADVEVGSFVRAELTQDADGNLVAVSIELRRERLEDEGDVEVTGRIEAISDTEITVGDQTFVVTTDTEVKDHRGDDMDFSALLEGQVVKVEGHIEGEGDEAVLVADEVKVRGTLHGTGALTGTVTGIEDDAIVVEGVRFRVNGVTLFDDGTSLADFQEGDVVEVRFRLLGDGSRLALKVEAAESGEGDVDVSGLVNSAAGNEITVGGIDMMLGFTVGNGPDDPLPGRFVEVKASQDNGMLVVDALNTEDAVLLTAGVTSIHDGTLRVGGRDVALTATTLVVDEDNAEVPSSAITVGTVVDVFAVAKGETTTKTHASTLAATRIVVTSRQVAVAIEQETADVPQRFSLQQNYPNPFNPSTKITFEVANLSGSPAPATLVVYNVLGQEVKTLVDRALTPGRYSVQWNGVDDAGRAVASGVYLYRLKVGDQVQTRTMTLLK